MKRRIKFISFLLIMTAVIAYINHGIATYDMRFHSGKDGGMFVQFTSICLLSSFYFALITDRNVILDGIYGLFWGFVMAIVSGPVNLLPVSDKILGPVYQVSACIMFMATFFLIERNRTWKKNNYT